MDVIEWLEHCGHWWHSWMTVWIRSGRNSRGSRHDQDEGSVVLTDKKRALQRQIPVRKSLERLCEMKSLKKLWEREYRSVRWCLSIDQNIIQQEAARHFVGMGKTSQQMYRKKEHGGTCYCYVMTTCQWHAAVVPLFLLTSIFNNSPLQSLIPLIV